VYYHRRRYRQRYFNWRKYHQSQRARVAEDFGGIDEDVRHIFFRLPESVLTQFFHKYRDKYGTSAASYARTAYRKWKSGKVQPSAQTSERLLDTLPHFLHLEHKCELLRKLREKYRVKETWNLTVSLPNWQQPVIPLVNRLVHQAYSMELPTDVEKRLSWLASGDMQAGKALLAEVEAEAGRIALTHLESEFQNIAQLDNALPSREKLTHRIELAYGVINITIERSKKLSDNKQHEQPDVPKKQDASQSVARMTPANILQTPLENLDPEAQRRILETAANKGLDLQVERQRAARKDEASSRRMGEFIDDAHRINQIQGIDSHIHAGFETSSGRTSIELKKQSSVVTIVIAVIIGLVLIVLLNRA